MTVNYLRFAMAGTGFVLGAISGGAAFGLVSQNQFGQLIAGAVLGVIFVWLVTKIYMVGVFMVGAAAGASLAVFSLQLLGKAPLSPLLPLAAIAVGILAVLFQRWMVIVATASVGAAASVLSVHLLRTGTFDWQHLAPVETIAWGVLSLAGASRQLKK